MILDRDLVLAAVTTIQATLENVSICDDTDHFFLTRARVYRGTFGAKKLQLEGNVGAKIFASTLSFMVGSKCCLADDQVQHRDRRCVSMSMTVWPSSAAAPSACLSRSYFGSSEADRRAGSDLAGSLADDQRFSQERLICITETSSKPTKVVVRDAPVHRRTCITRRMIEEYGVTSRCPRCEACRKRFADIEAAEAEAAVCSLRNRQGMMPPQPNKLQLDNDGCLGAPPNPTAPDCARVHISSVRLTAALAC